jgi:CRISPR-associated protein Csm5
LGSGDYFDPTQFVIDDKMDLKTFSTSDLLETLTPEKLNEFSSLCINMNLLSLFRFFKENFKDTIPNRAVKISKDLYEDYKRVLNSGSRSNQIINQFELKKTSFNEIYQTAYIPGSSLKGSIKTAWMSNAAVKKSIRGETDIRDCERKVLGGTFSDDPFRFVKIADLLPASDENKLKPSRTMILYATNHSKNPTKDKDRSSLSVAFEVILPGDTFVGKANIEEPFGLRAAKAALPSEIIDLKSLAESSKEHYLKKLESQEELLKKLGCDFKLKEKIEEKYAETLFKTSFPVRLGHHSGAEFITLDGNRNIRIRRGPKPPTFQDTATTIWLASTKKNPLTRKNLAPFGWAMVEFI